MWLPWVMEACWMRIRQIGPGLPVESPPQDDRATTSEQGVSAFVHAPIYVFLAFSVNISLSLRPAGYGAM